MQLIERYPRIFLTLVALLFSIPGMADLPLLDRDEPRFAQATIEMMERDEWVVPYFNNEYRFDKPPLTYWWMRLHYNLLGKHEIAARLHSFFASLITALVLYQIALNSKLSRSKAVLSGMIWLGSLQVLIHSRVAVADMPLIACLTITLWALMKFLYREEELKPYSVWFYVIYVSMAIGFLTKGPLALMIPALSIGITFALSRKNKALTSPYKQLIKESLLGLPLMLLIISLWGIPALLETRGAYFEIGLKKHVIERGLNAFNERLYIPGIYYIFIIFIFMSPWISGLIPSLKKTWVERNLSPQNTLFLSWIMATFLIFSFYKTQLPHYILPAYPVIALLIARTNRSSFGSFFQVSLWIQRVVFLSLIISLSVLYYTLDKSEINPSLVKSVLFLLGFLSAILIASECFKNNKIKSCFVFIALASLTLIPFGKNLKDSHITVQTSQLINNGTKKYMAYISSGFSEPSLVWYLGNHFNFVERQSLDAGALSENDCLIVLSRKWKLNDATIRQWYSNKNISTIYDDKETIKQDFGAKNIDWVEGFNLSNGTWVELAVITSKD